MTWFTGVVLYLIIWWTILFAVLPWGVRTMEKPPAGHATSAPERPMLLKKAIATSVVAAVLWLIVYFIIQSDWLQLRVSP